MGLIAIILLGLGAMLGATAATMHMRARRRAAVAPPPPLWIALVHGAFVVPGLIVLTWSVAVQYGFASLFGLALGAFVLAAIGGIVMFRMHVLRRPLPPLLIIGHGLTALAAYAILITAAVRGPATTSHERGPENIPGVDERREIVSR